MASRLLRGVPADAVQAGAVGVATTKRYELKEVSNDFFDEDEG